MTTHAPKRPLYWVIVGTLLLLLLAVLVIIVISVFQALEESKLQNTSEELTTSQLTERAVVERQSGNFDAAETYLQEALVKETSLDTTAQLAVVKYRLRKYEESIMLYQQIIDNEGEKAFAWNGIGNSYRDWAELDEAFRDQRSEEALKAYAAAVEADPRYISAYSNWAILLDTMGRFDEAIEVANRGYQATGRSELAEVASRLQNRGN